jgi:hypothetical protein
MPSSDKILSQVEKDLKSVAVHERFTLTDNISNDVEEYVEDNKADSVSKRQKAYGEVRDFWDQLEDDAEAIANEQYEKEYQKQCDDMQRYINGEEQIVWQAFDRVFDSSEDQVSLPFNIKLGIGYNKSEHKASVSVEIPSSLGIPTQRQNISATYGRISIKDKLVKEIDSDTSKTIVGLAYYIASIVFNVSPNIDFIELSVLSNNGTSGYLWIYFLRSKFIGLRPKGLDPLAGIFDWEYVCDMKIIRGGTRIDPIQISNFNDKVGMQRLAVQHLQNN